MDAPKKDTREESKLEALIVSLDDLVFEIDSKGIFLNAWASDESRFFVPKSVFLGQKITSVIPGELGTRLFDSFQEVLTSKKHKETEYLSPVDNKYYLARINFVKCNTGSDRVSVLIRDITERKNFEIQLLEAKNQAEQALKIKSDFLSAISHEIRTPMNAILGFTNIILEHEHEPQILAYLNSIKYSSDNLLILINELLDFNKLDSGVINFEKLDFDLYKEIYELEKNFSLKAAEKSICFKSQIAADVPKFVTGDPYRLHQALGNLLSNAIKFTHTGGIDFSIELKQKQNRTHTICFAIADTGIGIHHSVHENIFESFVQASASISREFGGTGLGLAITKKIIDRQNGKIYMESVPGKGSTFFVELPFLKASGNPQSEAPFKEQNFDLSAYHILIVEDNILNQLVIKKTLELCKANHKIVENGEKAIEILKKEHFDLVLMDLQMPEMDGLSATKHIRDKHSEVRNKNIPIIALTANAFTQSKVEALRVGMNDYIVKPFTKEELYNKIIKQLKD